MRTKSYKYQSRWKHLQQQFIREFQLMNDQDKCNCLNAWDILQNCVNPNSSLPIYPWIIRRWMDSRILIKTSGELVSHPTEDCIETFISHYKNFWDKIASNLRPASLKTHSCFQVAEDIDYAISNISMMCFSPAIRSGMFLLVHLHCLNISSYDIHNKLQDYHSRQAYYLNSILSNMRVTIGGLYYDD